MRPKRICLGLTIGGSYNLFHQRKDEKYLNDISTMWTVKIDSTIEVYEKSEMFVVVIVKVYATQIRVNVPSTIFLVR